MWLCSRADGRAGAGGGTRTAARTLCSLFDPILQDQGESLRVKAPGGLGQLGAFTAADSPGLLP